MSAAAGRLVRLTLLAYPRAFRRAYGDELARCMRDMRRHGGASRAQVACRVAADVLLTAPRMRLEALMNRKLAVTVALGTVALLAAAAIVPLSLLLLVPVIAGAVFVSLRHDGPIAAEPAAPARWLRYVLYGLAALGVGSAILIIDGGELSEPAWAAWALTSALGIVLVGCGIVLAVAERWARRTA